MVKRAVLALMCVMSAEAFVQGPSMGLASRRSPAVAPRLRAGANVRRSPGAALRMQEDSSVKEDKKEGEAAGAADPYAVKQEVPSWAEEENQWEIDEAAGGASAADKQKKLVAVGTGAVALSLSLAYLAAVALLESRGPLQPPPCEATDTC